jgi:SPP1 gp7 family putative phage head morphogenesis protein
MADLNLTPGDISMVFNMPPEAAILFLQKKGFIISWDWLDVYRHAHVNAATIAKMTRLDLLADVYAALADDLKNGGTFHAFKTKMVPLMQAKGWWGQRQQTNKFTGEIRTVTYGTPYRLETIYETNLQVAYMAGRYAGMMAATRYAPWWEYSAVMDSRTRPQHAALNGLVFRYDDPFWSTWYPPNGFRCRCRVIPRTDIEHDRGDFQTSIGEGRMEQTTREIRKADGKTATVRMTGYRNSAGQLITPDLGWDYNPGAERARLDRLFGDKQAAAPAPIRNQSKRHDND